MVNRNRHSRRPCAGFLVRCVALGAAALASVATPARAQTATGGDVAIDVRVAGDGRPGFVSALRIQTGGFARVVVGAALPGATPQERRASALSLLGRERPAAVVWFESPGGAGRRALYVLGRGPAGLRTEVFLAGRESSFDDDRELALKVRLALDAIAAGTPSPRGAVDEPEPEPEPEPELEPELRPEPPEPPPPPLRMRLEASHTWLGAHAGLFLPLGGPQLQSFVGAAAGTSWTRSFGYLAAYGVVSAATAQTDETEDGTASAWELGGRLGARVGVERGPWRVGGAAEAGLRVAFASGETAAGAAGDDVAYIPALYALGEAMWSPFASREPGWRLRLAVGTEVSLVRQRFAVNQRDVLDLGRARPVVQLGVLYRLP